MSTTAPDAPPFCLNATRARASQSPSPALHVQPNTPTSPSYPPSLLPVQRNPPTACGVAALPADATPPASVPSMSQPAASAAPRMLTPASSITGGAAAAAAVLDGDGDVAMADAAVEPLGGAAALGEHRRSNHERPDAPPAAAQAVPPLGGQPKPEFVYPLSRPHPTDNLMEMYGLADLANTFARTDPTTGAKINKLRKSYESHVRSLVVLGKPKAVRKDEGFLSEYVRWPDDEYHAQRVFAKDVRDGLSTSSLEALGPATSFTTTRLPTSTLDKVRHLLLLDERARPREPSVAALPATTALSPVSVLPSTAMGMPSSAVGMPSSAMGTPVAANATPVAAVSAAPRNPRTGRGTKRRYDESSYDGYGEAFGDDVDSLADDDARASGAKKRRRKDVSSVPSTTSTPILVGGASVGPLRIKR